jgi:ABC-2 type transport system permease protein
MVSRLGRLARIYARIQVLNLRAQLEYKADFWIGVVGVALLYGAGLVFVWALFGRVPRVAGWSLWEVAFLYALAIIPRGLVLLLADGPWRLRHLVNSGEFDRLLLRPLSPALQVATQLSSLYGLGTVALGVVILLRAVAELRPAWHAGHLLFLCAALLGATLLIAALDFATHCIVFWQPASHSAFPVLVGNLIEFAKFPLTLYGQAVQLALTWLLPIAFVSYYPSLVLLGKPQAQPWLGYGAPLAGPAVVLVASLIWGRALARYQSAGH